MKNMHDMVREAHAGFDMIILLPWLIICSNVGFDLRSLKSKSKII